MKYLIMVLVLISTASQAKKSMIEIVAGTYKCNTGSGVLFISNENEVKEIDLGDGVINIFKVTNVIGTGSHFFVKASGLDKDGGMVHISVYREGVLYSNVKDGELQYANHYKCNAD